MPWRVETPMSQRQDFVEAWARGHWHPTELCARFGISRKTGYKCWHRYQAGGLAALVAASRHHPYSGGRAAAPHLMRGVRRRS
jgi:putative transposase